MSEANSGRFETGAYDFCLFRIPEEGGRVLWQVTNVCNYTCSYCIFASGPEKIDGELETEDFMEALEGLQENGFTHIKFTGGEPFVRRDMIDILQKACDLEMVVDISTNASRISEQQAVRLAAMELNMVHVSMDGHDPATHESVRGARTYERTMRGLRALVSEGIYVRVGTVLFDGNDGYVREMAEFCAEEGVQEVAFSLMEPAGRIAGDDSLVTRIPRTELIRTIEETSEEMNGTIRVRHNLGGIATGDGQCPGGSKFLYIDNLGRVSPCTWVAGLGSRYTSEQDLKAHSMQEILESAPISSYLRRIEQARAEGYQGCPLQGRDRPL